MNLGEFVTRLFARRRAQVGALLFAILAFFSIFAEWIACDVPLFATYQGRSHVLPAITEPALFAEMQANQIAELLAPTDIAVWPILRVGPRAVTAEPMSAPSRGHLLGTDAFGRDVFARLVHGARTSLFLGGLVAGFALLAGFALGSLGGALGGLWDSLIERLVEIVGVFPAVVAVALVRSLERRPSLLSLVLVMAAIKWAEMARLTRVLVLRSMAEEWALAARSMGASPLRIALRHVGPHLAAPLSIGAVLAMASVALTETSLSFLELGVPATTVSWGEMLGEVRFGAGARVLLPPLLALGIMVGALYLVADAIRKTFEA